MISRLLSHRLLWAWALFAVLLAFGGGAAQAITYNYFGDPFTSILNAGGATGQDLSLSAYPLSQEVKRGKVASYSVCGLDETEYLTVTGVPSNAICYIKFDGSGTVIVDVDTSPGKKGTPKGSYELKFEGISGGVSSTTTVTLVVR